MTEEVRKGSPSREDFEKEVIRRATTDPDFRRRLLADPKAALQATYGMELPKEIELQVLGETPSKFYLVLPVMSDELTDEQLGAVAGGTGMPHLQESAGYAKWEMVTAAAIHFGKF